MEGKIIVSIFRGLIESITELLNECVLDFTPDGLSLQAMDPAHVSLIDAKLKKEAFTNYHCKCSYSIGIGLNSLVKILRCTNDKDSLILTLNESNEKILNILINSFKNNCITEYTLQLITIEREVLEMKGIDFLYKVEMPSNELTRYFRDLSQFGETITIALTKEKMVLSCDNFDIKARISIKSGKFTKITLLQIEQQVKMIKQNFSARYLNIIGRASRIGKQSFLQMGSEVPLKLQFILNNDNCGYVTFYLVSKVGEMNEDI